MTFLKLAPTLFPQLIIKPTACRSRVARFGTFFGRGDSYFNLIVPGVMELVIKSRELQIRSNGKFRRDYLFVKDVAEGS